MIDPQTDPATRNYDSSVSVCVCAWVESFCLFIYVWCFGNASLLPYIIHSNWYFDELTALMRWAQSPSELCWWRKHSIIIIIIWGNVEIEKFVIQLNSLSQCSKVKLALSLVPSVYALSLNKRGYLNSIMSWAVGMVSSHRVISSASAFSVSVATQRNRRVNSQPKTGHEEARVIMFMNLIKRFIYSYIWCMSDYLLCTNMKLINILSVFWFLFPFKNVFYHYQLCTNVSRCD